MAHILKTFHGANYTKTILVFKKIELFYFSFRNITTWHKTTFFIRISFMCEGTGNKFKNLQKNFTVSSS